MFTSQTADAGKFLIIIALIVVLIAGVFTLLSTTGHAIFGGSSTHERQVQRDRQDCWDAQARGEIPGADCSSIDD